MRPVFNQEETLEKARLADASWGHRLGLLKSIGTGRSGKEEARDSQEQEAWSPVASGRGSGPGGKEPRGVSQTHGMWSDGEGGQPVVGRVPGPEAACAEPPANPAPRTLLLMSRRLMMGAGHPSLGGYL